jgi:ketosteroid isomerase-like protein
VEENKALIAKIFAELAAGNSRALLSRTAESSRWTITGTSPVSGVFKTRQEFYEKALATVTSRLTARVKPTVLRILGEGDLVVVEWRGESVTKTGVPYNNAYCWVLRLRGGEIIEGTIYSDTELVSRIMK